MMPLKGDGTVEVEIRLEPGRREPKVVILTGEVTGQVRDLARRLGAGESRFLPGYREGQVILMEPEDIVRVYAQGQQVFARLEGETVTVRLRLYELEERWRGTSIVRVSHSELVNFDKVRSLDLSMAGTISLRLSNGESAYVSRRYMRRIKEYLGI